MAPRARAFAWARYADISRTPGPPIPEPMFKAYQRGNIRWPQMDVGIEAYVLPLVLEDPVANVAALGKMRGSEAQVDAVAQALNRAHAAFGVSLRTGTDNAGLPGIPRNAVGNFVDRVPRGYLVRLELLARALASNGEQWPKGKSDEATEDWGNRVAKLLQDNPNVIAPMREFMAQLNHVMESEAGEAASAAYRDKFRSYGPEVWRDPVRAETAQSELEAEAVKVRGWIRKRLELRLKARAYFPMNRFDKAAQIFELYEVPKVSGP